MDTPVDLSQNGYIATITINRPEKRNALSTEVVEALNNAFRTADASDARVIILTGAGDKAFSAGGDLQKFLAENEKGPGRQGGAFVALFETMAGLGKPVIGRINGHCLAGAFGIALACDMLVAVDDAAFGTPEIRVGLWPMMISALIWRKVPRNVANEMMFTGRRYSGSELQALGVVNQVVAREELDTTVNALAEQLAGLPPQVIALGRRALYAQQDMAFADGLHFLEGQLREVLQTDDAREGIRAFLEKRPPNFG
ncbi:MAG: hypothetical protein D6761_10310 [Candidatus Dadabacteria bacterium]|nr:MAG: hypothetical protein D6761_10310 [Candidatus Dadabacteria bacterium]